ncbi:MAG TPA: ABC transporter substrate-binding protein [Chloroflexota bacterium]|nr:ABC transporter substrate-binding protein [Chloroflexota bacterium]
MVLTRRAFILGTGLALGALAAACGQAAPATPSPTAPQAAAATPTPPAQPSPRVVEKVVTQVVEKVVTPTPAVNKARAEVLNIALGGRIADPTNLNLYSPAVDRSIGLHQVIYEYFFYLNLQTGQFIPWLAESYSYNNDFSVLTVKLRNGVTWSDGQPFTADDVVFTYDLLKKNEGMVWAAETNQAVDTVEKVDDHTVAFKLKSPNPRFHLIREAFPAVGIWGGVTILPKHIWEGKDPLTFKNSNPVGTGPYKLVSATPTALTFERRDDWWALKVLNIPPGPKTINFQYIGPETNVALALANNEIDTPFIGILSAGSFKEVARRNPKVRAWQKDPPYSWLDPCPRALMVQNARPPYDKKEVRWALSYMIDRQAVVNLAYEGVTVPTWGIWPFYDGNKPYFDAISDLLKQYPVQAHDPAKARDLLKSVGLTPSDLHPTYVVDSDANEDMKVAQVISDQLQREGVKVKLQPMSGSPLTDTILRGNYDLALNAFCPGYIVENLDLFHSKNYRPLGQNAPWFERNSYRYRNPQLDAVVDQMFKVDPNDTAKLIDLYKQAMAIWLPDLPVIPIVQAPALVPFNFAYWENWPTAENPWNMPVSWWATFNLVIHGFVDPKTGQLVKGIHSAVSG